MLKLTAADFIVHYNRDEPFRSISSAPIGQRQSIIENLNTTNAWGLNRFTKPECLKQRVQAESQLRNTFIAEGGKPQLEHPIYFFLGRNKRFEEHKLNKGYKINLEHILSKHVSFTYGDCMLAFIEENRNQSGFQYISPLCGDVYRMEEPDNIYSSIHFPKEEPLAIEAQLWFVPSLEITEILTDIW